MCSIYHFAHYATDAVLEANVKVIWRCQISHPQHPKTLEPIWMAIQIYHYVRPRSRCSKFGGNQFGLYESAHVCFKRVSVWICFVNILSIPFFGGATGHILGRS